MAGFPRILKSPCASKENRFPKLNLPTVYQRNRRAKLAVNTQTPVQVDSTSELPQFVRTAQKRHIMVVHIKF